MQVLQFLGIVHTAAIQARFSLFNFYFLAFGFRFSHLYCVTGVVVLGLCLLEAVQRLTQFHVVIERLLNNIQLRLGAVNLAVDLLQTVESQCRAHVLIIYEVPVI